MQQKLFDLPILKRCQKCKELKPANKEYFSWCSKRSNFHSYCKPCIKANDKKWRAEHRKERKARARKYRVTHLDKCKARAKKYQTEHWAERQAYHKKWYAEHRQEVKICNKKRYQEHIEERKIHDKKYYQENAEKIKACVKKYQAEHPKQYKRYHFNYNKRKLGSLSAIFDMSDSDMIMESAKWSRVIRKNKPCAICNQKAVHAHHILYISNYPALSLNPNNGIPLCIEHHAEAHLFDGYANLIKGSWNPQQQSNR